MAEAVQYPRIDLTKYVECTGPSRVQQVVLSIKAVADAPLVLFDLGYAHGLYPHRWRIKEHQDGRVTLVMFIRAMRERVEDALPDAQISNYRPNEAR